MTRSRAAVSARVVAARPVLSQARASGSPVRQSRPSASIKATRAATSGPAVSSAATIALAIPERARPLPRAIRLEQRTDRSGGDFARRGGVASQERQDRLGDAGRPRRQKSTAALGQQQRRNGPARRFLERIARPFARERLGLAGASCRSRPRRPVAAGRPCPSRRGIDCESVAAILQLK